MENMHVFIDFDSTFAKVETLEEIVNISYKNEEKRKNIFAKIKNITDLAMEGKYSFGDALKERVNLLDINKKNIEETTQSIKNKISDSFLTNKEFIKTHKNNIYILSGGFKECIIPIAKEFDISEDHVFANEFLYDENGKVIGVDTKNPLSQEGGKIQIVNNLQLEGKKVSIGDGYNDYKLKEGKAVDTFLAFIENIERKSVTEKADGILKNFDDFITWSQSQ